jgi:hypothetical protein
MDYGITCPVEHSRNRSLPLLKRGEIKCSSAYYRLIGVRFTKQMIDAHMLGTLSSSSTSLSLSGILGSMVLPNILMKD